jgi:diacylglycerol kinase family enzyme
MRSKAELQAAIRQHRRAVLVVNTRSRRGARMYRDAGRQLEAAGFGLHTDPPLPLDIDGEISGQTPARITLAPNALRVMVGPGFPDT